MAHTKGPLTTRQDSKGADMAILDESGYIIGEAYWHVGQNAYRDAGANAKLWSNARLLLGACKYVLARLDQIDGGGGFDQLDANECRILLRARIAAAEPEPQDV